MSLFAKLRALLTPIRPEPLPVSFLPNEIAMLHTVLGASSGAVDDQTWDGLLLEPYLATLSDKVSIVGQQMLYRRLREDTGDTARAAMVARLRALMGERAGLELLHAQFGELRGAEADIAPLLFSDTLPVAPAWAGKGWLLGAGLVASLAASLPVFQVGAWALAGVVPCLLALVGLQIRYGERVDAMERKLVVLRRLLFTCGQPEGDSPGLAAFDPWREAAVRLHHRMSPTKFAIPGTKEYANWFMLADVELYFKAIIAIAAERDVLRACFLCCAELEADLTLARHLLGTNVHCWVERAADGGLTFEQAIHPLLADPVPLSLASSPSKGAFISGQNGIGKSTLLRTVGLNLVTARAFGFCYARRAQVNPRPVYASMQSEDNLDGGESLYMAELRRAQEMLAAAERPEGGVFIIDEIFRGTNHLESVSAAAAVLDQLAARGLVIVSSHNLVLGALLAHRLAPFCVGLVDGRLRLAPGVLAQTNGLRLLADRGFGPAVEGRAARVFDWLSTYLAHPPECGHVLDADAGRVPLTSPA
jgi:hypothetical protein